MNIGLKKNTKTRALILISVYAFLFNTTFPFFQTLSAAPTDGYTTVVCTLFGEETVFVSLPEQDSTNNHSSDCPKCPACIVLTNASVWFPAFDFSVSAALFRQSHTIAELSANGFNIVSFSHYLIRAPPA
ncbi:MAG: hypothetical protein GY820_12810 [Gammaproteobacteria bacterium]|nr:hypothetical protein [Gammaproteobacteria bacterium]